MNFHPKSNYFFAVGERRSHWHSCCSIPECITLQEEPQCPNGRAGSPWVSSGLQCWHCSLSAPRPTLAPRQILRTRKLWSSGRHLARTVSGFCGAIQETRGPGICFMESGAYTTRLRHRPTDSFTRTATEARSEEHTSELQSQFHLVCRLLLEKKKN